RSSDIALARDLRAQQRTTRAHRDDRGDEERPGPAGDPYAGLRRARRLRDDRQGARRRHRSGPGPFGILGTAGRDTHGIREHALGIRDAESGIRIGTFTAKTTTRAQPPRAAWRQPRRQPVQNWWTAS